MEKKYFLYLFFYFLFFSPLQVFSQDISGKPDLNALSPDHIFSENIKTFILQPEGTQFALPLITLGSDNKLELKFDELGIENKHYKYNFVYCNAEWDATELPVSDYISGFAEGDITQVTFSRNTLIDYCHYSLQFPEQSTQFILPGNYLIVVYADDTKDKPIIIAHFYVVESQLTIDAKVQRATLLENSNTHQEISFSLHTSNYLISNPYQNLKIYIYQNQRFDNRISGIQPQMVVGNTIDYTFNEDISFEGGNEFRNFDTKDFRYQSPGTRKIEKDSLYIITLASDKKKPFQVYESQKDINGNFLIKSNDAYDNDTEADYCIVVFTLPADVPYLSGNVYIFGGLTQWQ
ncbi:MAG: DUF5103 domain-containing protein [Lentimicrobiaceae bacterium]|nr:DUF5103 domain-containing protein [Lentimicrobiaceae bacterium]